MARKLKSDKVLFIATSGLVALSVVMVYSASAPMALDRYGRATRFRRPAISAVLGIAMLTVFMRIDYRYHRGPSSSGRPGLSPCPVRGISAHRQRRAPLVGIGGIG
jgi:cell division protein FtsW (lipid II flippase)